MQTAKLFNDGRSQAVRLPAAFRFAGDAVFIRRDEKTGDVILSAKPADWTGFFAAVKGLKVPDGFLGKEERDLPENRRDPFAGLDG
ncbi:MAG: AbrB/MazE/SpoVT family DNA-binding domain-containing protein [Candidatus Accumulibacter sp.]|jgi:antitoxin VapB|nr:AbrB/MazE/SpoVT family DNA-binding domain-containing protein [Accumulibacter sp.]